MEELWQEANSASFQNSVSVGSLPPLSQTSSQMRKSKQQKPQRVKWDEGFNLLGSDHRKPTALRRYFDEIPGENTIPKGYRGDGDHTSLGKAFKAPAHLQARRPWVETHEQTVSGDNEALHPHLRSYFDRRGLESCYRQRPNVDATTKRMRPRTPQRPTTREKILRFRSLSEPSLQDSSVMSGGSSGQEEELGAEGRHHGGINWGARCLMTGTDDFKVNMKGADGEPQKLPWVTDHQVTVCTDNVILNPMLRHYFDKDGLESSFRNRGMHYGRKPKPIMGVTPGKKKRRGSMDTSSSWDSVRSSLLDNLSYTSLMSSSTPGGLPGVRRLDAANLGSMSASAPNLGRSDGSARSGSLGGSQTSTGFYQ